MKAQASQPSRHQIWGLACKDQSLHPSFRDLPLAFFEQRWAEQSRVVLDLGRGVVCGPHRVVEMREEGKK